MDELFVPDNSYLMCNKGDKITRLKVTHHNNTTVYGENVASEADMVPGENIEPFGKCTKIHKPCAFDPLYWDKTREHYKVNGYKLLVESACLICKKGGEISISLTLPAGGTVAGAGKGLQGGITNMQNQPWFNHAVELANELKTADLTGAKNGIIRDAGNFGEIRTAQELMAKGYKLNGKLDPSTGKINYPHSTTIAENLSQGLDHSATGGNIDILVEAKNPSILDKGKLPSTNHGPQLSDEWLINPSFRKKTGSRLQTGLEADDAARITNKVLNNSPDLYRYTSITDPKTGKVTFHNMTDLPNGKFDPTPTKIPVPNFTNGSGRASNFINNVSSSIQNTKPISKGNSLLVQNADKVAKVGKNLGKGALVVGIMMDGISIYQGFQADGGKIGENTTTAVGSAAGGMAGGLLGAKAGAMIGAVGGPVGVLVGGVIGGVIGGIAGSGIGAKIGKFFGGLFK